MREIKFRGKRIDNGEWKYGDLLHIVGGCVIYHGSQKESELIEERPNLAIELYMDEVSPVTPDTVGQFTGVKDKNGKDVYEDDIVLQQQYGGGKGKMIVRFEKGAFIVGYHSGSSTRKTPMLLNDRCEVIGNIHDNPELLK